MKKKIKRFIARLAVLESGRKAEQERVRIQKIYDRNFALRTALDNYRVGQPQKKIGLCKYRISNLQLYYWWCCIGVFVCLQLLLSVGN